MKNELSRRGFLAASGMACSAPGLLSDDAVARSANKREGKSGMRVGSDTDKLSAVKKDGPIAILDFLHAQGFEGAFFRTMLDMSPALDPVELGEIKSHADSLGLYLESGIGWVNPYNTAETPHIRKFGNGDYRLAMGKMIAAARAIDCTELWVVSGHSVHGNPPFIAYDRFRTDVSWGDQMRAMIKFINSFAPLLRDSGCRVNLEVHGDETSFELVRLVEEIGPDVTGVTLDTGNLPLAGDIPLAAIERLAPYVHLTHCKDGILYRSPEGLVQQLRPVGEGIMDWEQALLILGKYSPNLHLSFEDYRAENLLPVYDPQWRAHFPELTDADVEEFGRLAEICEGRIKRGEIAGIEEFRNLPYGNDGRLYSMKAGANHLRNIISTKGL